MKSFVFYFFNQIYWQYFSRNKIKYRETDGRMEIKTCNHIYKHFPALESGELNRYILGGGDTPRSQSHYSTGSFDTKDIVSTKLYNRMGRFSTKKDDLRSIYIEGYFSLLHQLSSGVQWPYMYGLL